MGKKVVAGLQAFSLIDSAPYVEDQTWIQHIDLHQKLKWHVPSHLTKRHGLALWRLSSCSGMWIGG